MAPRLGSAEWSGTLQEGAGRVRVGPGRWEADYSFRSRFAERGTGGTNPEELLAAAHSGCFAMALTHVLTEAGRPPRSVSTRARVHLRAVDGTPTITLVELDAGADVDGLDEDAFRRHAESAKAGCALTRALAGVAEIRLTASLRGR
ncbi:OsmC family peroxiredoxin [Pseudonocardia humida]|uniref:OsmC family peroxiredoxin n=1 Tax=Pseudonocardia humida TaxID=2800819 RepID=A0ABT1A4R8_9PSEU|nr:OsmC family peroxiredoxin [Pseudonocardia humida]MCO1657975.1 OsmC family peroxiredoxin [Pseudonocardia humida]